MPAMSPSLSPSISSVSASAPPVAQAYRWMSAGDSPLIKRTKSGKNRINTSATSVSSNTGANNSASFISMPLNSPPETICPRAFNSQNTNTPIARTIRSR